MLLLLFVSFQLQHQLSFNLFFWVFITIYYTSKYMYEGKRNMNLINILFCLFVVVVLFFFLSSEI